MNQATLSYVDVMSILTLFICLFYAFQNFSFRKNKSRAKRYFTFYLLTFSFFIFFFFLLHVKLQSIAKFLIPLLIFSTLSLSPLLWIYQKELVSSRINKKNFKHFLVPIVFTTFFSIFFVISILTNDVDLKIKMVEILQALFLFGYTSIFIVQNIVYITMFIIKYIKHVRNIQHYYSYTEKINLRWLLILVIGYIFLIVGIISCELFLDAEWSDVVFYSVLSIYMVFTGHNALRQKEVIINLAHPVSKSDQLVENDQFDESVDVEEQFSEAQLQLFQELKQKLEAYIEGQKPYLDQELTIFKLAKELNSNTRYLSHIINKEYGQNFIHYINEFRIAEVKKNLLDQGKSNYTIEALAQHAGFKSKSSFNAAFKKSTGKTPSDFIREHLN